MLSSLGSPQPQCQRTQICLSKQHPLPLPLARAEFEARKATIAALDELRQSAELTVVTLKPLNLGAICVVTNPLALFVPIPSPALNPFTCMVWVHNLFLQKLSYVMSFFILSLERTLQNSASNI